MKRFLSIRLKIFFSILTFMTIPLIALTYLTNQVSMESLLEQNRLYDLQTIDSLREATDTLLDSFESLGQLISLDPSVIQFLESSDSQESDFKDVIGQYLDFSDALLGISVVNNHHVFVGEQVFDTDQLSWYFNKTLFQNMDTMGQYWTAPHILLNASTQEKFWAISYVTPVYHENERLGYLILYMDRSRLEQITTIPASTVYVINDSEIASNIQSCYIISNKTYLSEEYSLITASFYDKSKINYNYLVNNSSVIISVNGTKLTVTSHKYPRMGWIFLIVSPYADINQQVLSPLSRIFVICGASVIFTIISAFIISHTITRSIYSLNGTINQVTEGNLDIRHTKITNDEIGTLALAFNSLLDKIQELMYNISQQQKSKRILQLQLIQAQVKPHFLYNVLEMISSFIREHLDSYALDSIAHLANFYRTSLSDGSDIITIKKEIDMINNYLALQHLRYIEFMDFSLDISEEILNYKIPKLTLQPIVENAIYHGLKTKCEKGILNVHGYLKEDVIFFEVYDNGAGMDQAVIDSIMNSLNQEILSKDFGISSVMKRLNIYFNNNATIEIQSEVGKYTNFILSFPALKL